LPFCSITLSAKKPLEKAYPTELLTIGHHLRKRRLDLGLRQRDVAYLLCVDTTTVTNWEKNRTTPTLRCTPRIIEFLGYNPRSGNDDTVGWRLLRYRKSRGTTQQELAGQIGIDPATLRKLEKGRGKQDPTVLQKINAFLDSVAATTAPRDPL
jgi:transcriptional regulator with XRE-family HTH domain